MTIAISPPLTVWMIYCSIVVLSTLLGRSKAETESIGIVTLALAVGIGALTISLLAAGYSLAFLLLEAGVWMFGISIAALAAGIRPPTGPKEDTRPAKLALAVSLRLIIALGVWLSL